MPPLIGTPPPAIPNGLGASAFMPGGCVGDGPFDAGWLVAGRWYVVADAIALKRNQFGSVPFASLNDRTNVVLSTQPRDFPFRYGMRLLVGRTLTPWLRVEGLYFGLTNWRETVAVRDATPNTLGGTGNLLSRISDFGNPPITGVDFNNLATLNLTSALDNAEINLRHRLMTPPCMEVSFLVGMRFINIREHADYFTSANVPTPTGATNLVSTSTANNLLGAQLGGTLNVPIYDAWWIGLDLKGALSANSANQHTAFTNTGIGPGTQTFRGGKGLTTSSLVGDLGLALNCQCTEHIACRMGYQALFVNGLSLASENVERNFDILTLGPANLAHRGQVVYHGPHLGIMVVW